VLLAEQRRSDPASAAHANANLNMLGRFASTVLPSHSTLEGVLRVATYNIHKGVRGLGLRKRLEIHNLGLGIEALDADMVFLQEVRLFHHRDAARFDHTWFGWPEQGQADFLAPEGFSVAYRTNAVTRHGEHGNALLSRWPIGDCGHFDVSDHRFEQRGLLHVPVQWEDTTVHAIVAHLGLIHASRVRQVQLVRRFIDDHVPAGACVIVAGDFNDWGEKLDPAMSEMGLHRARTKGRARGAPRAPGLHSIVPLDKPTFPSRVPVFALDRIYTRGLTCRATYVPRGPSWTRMSDHLPLVAEFERA
jgi:endonuclease/exonuclease/phosphatase family metal-dependent hydrolase